MEERDRSAIAALHPHDELAQDRHAKVPVIATHRSSSPGVETVLRPNCLRFEDDTGVPGFELAVLADTWRLWSDKVTERLSFSVPYRSVGPRTLPMTEKVTSFCSPGWSTETPFAYSDALKATEVGDPAADSSNWCTKREAPFPREMRLTTRAAQRWRRLRDRHKA